MKQWRQSMNYRNCGKTMGIAILMSFLTLHRGFAELPTTPPMSSEASGTRLYSDSEIDLLIEDLTQAAEEAIEKAAAEAAKASVLASLDREAGAMREAQRWRSEAETAKKTGTRNAIIAGVICFLGGLAVGAGSIAILGGVR
jgi:hypothetical protein